MTTQKRYLETELIERGWTIQPEEKLSWEWWADDVWMLRHDNSNAVIYLTFVVDPHYDQPRRKGEAIYGVTASRDEIQKNHDVSLYFGRGWEKKLNNFLEELGKLAL